MSTFEALWSVRPRPNGPPGPPLRGPGHNLNASSVTILIVQEELFKTTNEQCVSSRRILEIHTTYAF